MQPLRLESIDLEITTKCNMSCAYCYIGIAKMQGERNFGDMSNETIEKVIDLIYGYGHPTPWKDKQGRNQKATTVTFYGGEPLVSFERVQYFVNRSRERGCKLQFSALSNGTIGNPEMVKWFKDNNIWVQRSIDGCPEAQEKYRPNSIAAYEEATKVWKDFESSRRMTIQPEFAKLLMKSLHYFEGQGFHKGISPMPNYYAEWTEEQKKDFEKAIWDLGDYYIDCWNKGKPFYCYYFSREMVGRFMEPQKAWWGCGGGRGLHCVTWDGNLIMCHRFAREKPDSRFFFGTLDEVLKGTAKGYGDDVKEMNTKYERGRREDWPEKCKNCIAQYSCEKCCMHVNWNTAGTLLDMPDLYCRIRQVSARKVTLMDSLFRCKDPDWWTRGNTIPAVQDYVRRKQSPEYLTARLGEAVLRVEMLKKQIQGASNGNRSNCSKGC